MAAGLDAGGSLHTALAPLRKQLRTNWSTFGAPAAQELRDQGRHDIAVAITTAVTSGSASQWARSEVPIKLPPLVALHLASSRDVGS